MNQWLLARLSVVFALGLAGWAHAQDPAGLRPTVFAIRNARVVVDAETVIPTGTVVVRQGIIHTVGATTDVPADALVIDGDGLTVYPGFVDGLSIWGVESNLRRSEGGPPAPFDLSAEPLIATKPDNRKGLTPEFEAATALKADPDQADAWRKQGFTARLVAPDGGIIGGQSALASLSDAVPREAVISAPVALHIALRTVGGGDYPRALMGVVALSRQTFLDARHARETAEYLKTHPGTGRTPFDPALAALDRVMADKRLAVFDADTRDEIDRALAFAAEFGLRPVIAGGRDAGLVADKLAAAHVPVLLRLTFPETPAKLRRATGTMFEPEADAHKDDGAIPARVLADRERLLKREIATAATLEKHGVRFAFSAAGLEKPEKFRERLRKVIDAGLPVKAALKALTQSPADIFGVGRQLGSVTPGKSAHLLVLDGEFNEADTRARHVFADGIHFEYEAKGEKSKHEKGKPAEKADTGGKPGKPADKPGSPGKPGKTEGSDKPPEKPAEPKASPAATANPETPSEIDADRVPAVRTGGTVVLRHATILTVANGTITDGDLFIRDGKIAAVGTGLKVPDGTRVIDAAGMFLMPGIIDTHCHFSISGGVNENSLSVVPEVRVRDAINSEDVQIYRAAAGGVTTARLLHGSANVIGGQDAVIKCKYGKPADGLLIPGAPRGVKFALGENVKRTDGRFPNTRLGVEAVLVRAFTEAREYTLANDRAATRDMPPPPRRRDLRLEALGEVLGGSLKVHCHCYRSDEILMLLRVADRFGVKIRSLQHVLEGYKVAPEIAAHGASCSLFADWWGYKIEAFDAIPQAAGILHDAGASVCLKSDYPELMRHLYQDAAKCVKYSGMTEAETLKTITLNAARQLGLEARIGTLEVGKDGDVAVFNGHPLNSYSRVEMTLIDGEVYFQRSAVLRPAPGGLAAAGPVGPTKPRAVIQAHPRDEAVFSNATVHPVSGPVIPRGLVRVRGGKIVEVADLALVKSPVPAGPGVIDCTGLHLYPGMIDAGTVVGLTEIGSARETHDYAESGDFQPDLRASTGINPDSEIIPVTRANGVTSVVTRPIGSVIAGQSALINLAGWVPREMTVIDPLALQIEFPSASPLFTADPNIPIVQRAIAKKQREEKVRRLKQLFRQATAYGQARDKAPNLPTDPRIAALVPYARGERPVVIQADHRQEILEALKLADELKLKVMISGGIEAWKVIDELKQRNVPVLLGPVMTMPQETYDPYDSPFTCAAKLHAAGIPFCIRSGGGTNTRNLPYEAAMAVSYGLPPDEGLKAVTLYPAQLLGVREQLGSIETGKRANFVLTNGDLLQASTQVKSILIDGTAFEPTSKQTRLADRYRERLREVKERSAPGGASR